MPLSWSTLPSSFEVNDVFNLVPVINLSDHHLAGGDGDPLVGIPVYHIDLTDNQ